MARLTRNPPRVFGAYLCANGRAFAALSGPNLHRLFTAKICGGRVAYFPPAFTHATNKNGPTCAGPFRENLCVRVYPFTIRHEPSGSWHAVPWAFWRSPPTITSDWNSRQYLPLEDLPSRSGVTEPEVPLRGLFHTIG